MSYNPYHWCAVPECKNTSVKTPEKLWIKVPTEIKMRNTWLKLARRVPELVSIKTELHFCEDHFDLEYDMENYMRYKIMGSVKRIQMKPNCVPSRFDCQANRKHQSTPNEPLLIFSKRQRMSVIEGGKEDTLENKDAEPSSSSNLVRKDSTVAQRRRLYRQRLREKKTADESNSGTGSSLLRRKDTTVVQRMRLYRQRLREKKIADESNSGTGSSLLRQRALTSTERSKLWRLRKKLSKENSSNTTIQSSVSQNHELFEPSSTSAHPVMITSVHIEEEVKLERVETEKRLSDDDDDKPSVDVAKQVNLELVKIEEMHGDDDYDDHADYHNEERNLTASVDMETKVMLERVKAEKRLNEVNDDDDKLTVDVAKEVNLELVKIEEMHGDDDFDDHAGNDNNYHIEEPSVDMAKQVNLELVKIEETHHDDDDHVGYDNDYHNDELSGSLYKEVKLEHVMAEDFVIDDDFVAHAGHDNDDYYDELDDEPLTKLVTKVPKVEPPEPLVMLHYPKVAEKTKSSAITNSTSVKKSKKETNQPTPTRSKRKMESRDIDAGSCTEGIDMEMFQLSLPDLAVDSGSEMDDEEDFTTEETQHMLEGSDSDEEILAAEEQQSDFSWSSNFDTFTGQEEIYHLQPGPHINPTSPKGIFCNVWDRPVMEKIVKETNEYAWQTIANASEHDGGIRNFSRFNDWSETSVEELYNFFAIFMYMSLCYRTCIEEYWTTDILDMSEFQKLMSKDRFLLLLRFLHFIDNRDLLTNVHGYERKIAKIEPLVTHCNNKFREIYTPNRAISIGESLTLWKGRLSWKKCIRSKAARFRIKTYELCEAETGYLLKFIICTGKGSLHPTGDQTHGFTGLTSKTVLELMDGYLDKGHCLVMDDYYNSVPITRYLKRHRTDVIGTLNRRRPDTPPDIQSLNERNMRRGDVVAQHCGDVSVVAWKDVKMLTMVSTYHNSDTAPGQGAGEQILEPLVRSYNEYMGGVDLQDQKLSLYLLERKLGMKWYIKLFRRLLNCSVLNSYIIYQSFHAQGLCTKLSYREFRFALARELCSMPQAPCADSVQRIRTTTVDSTHCRLDKMPDHFPDHENEDVTIRTNKRKNRFKRRNCARCLKKKMRVETNVICTKCQVFLCVGQCWRDYHTLQNL